MPIFPTSQKVITSKERRLMAVKAPFSNEISGLAMIKLLDYYTLTTKSN